MSGGPKYEYLWQVRVWRCHSQTLRLGLLQDEVKHKKPVSLSAPEYICTLIEWVDDIIQNEQLGQGFKIAFFVLQTFSCFSVLTFIGYLGATALILYIVQVFPPTDDVPFPKTFKKTCSKVLRRLYRIFVHLYIEHFDRLEQNCSSLNVTSQYK